MSNAEDLLLVEQAKQGNQKAFTKLYNKYQNSIQYFVYLKVHNTTTAEDLAIEILSKALCNINAYEPTANFSTWLFKLAKNHCIDFIRTRYRRPNLISPTEEQIKMFSEIVDSYYANPEEITISKDEVARIEEHIENLNPTYKKTLKLYAFEDLKYLDISKDLGITINVVSGQIRYARKALSHSLNKDK